MSKLKQASEAFGRILDALPKAKKLTLFGDASTVELFYTELARFVRDCRDDGTLAESKREKAAEFIGPPK